MSLDFRFGFRFGFGGASRLDAPTGFVVTPTVESQIATGSWDAVPEATEYLYNFGLGWVSSGTDTFVNDGPTAFGHVVPMVKALGGRVATATAFDVPYLIPSAPGTAEITSESLDFSASWGAPLTNPTFVAYYEAQIDSDGWVNVGPSGAMTGSSTNGAHTLHVRAVNPDGVASDITDTDFTLILITTPANTVAPAISGTPSPDSELTCSTGTWSGGGSFSYSYQWKLNGVNVGTDSNAYTVPGDAVDGDLVYCVVTATNGAGSASESSDINTVATVSLPPYSHLLRFAYIPHGNSYTDTAGTTLAGDEDDVALVTDLLEGGALYENNASIRPTYKAGELPNGNAAIFVDYDRQLKFVEPFSQPSLTVFIVAKLDNAASPEPGNDATVFGDDSSALQYRFSSGKQQFVDKVNALLSQGDSSQSQSVWFQANASFDGYEMDTVFRMSGSADGSANDVCAFTSSPTAAKAFKRLFDSTGESFRSYFGALLMYGVALTTSQKIEVEAWITDQTGV